MSSLLTGTAVEGRRALRGLAASPGFSVGVVLVLGIAIAGMVTVATLAWSLFLRPLPFAQPEQLVRVMAHSQAMGFDVGFSPPMLDEVRSEPMVADVAAYLDAAAVEAPQGGNWQIARVTQNLARVLGVSPVLGRSFTPADAEPGAPQVVLISESAWRSRFDGAESVIGREIVLDEGPAKVIGVMPAAFTVPSSHTQGWRPMRFTPAERAPDHLGHFEGDDGLVVRLKPGFTAAQLEQALEARYASDPRAGLQSIQDLMGLEFRVQDLREAWTEEQRQPLAIIALASMLVLAAAAFNVAGLWLARLLGRSHDQAIQVALGAGSWRRLGRTVIEFVLLGAVGGGVSLALVPMLLRGLEAAGPLSLEQPLPVRTGLATFVITGIVLALGTIPVLASAAWQQARQRRNLLPELGGGARTRASGGQARRLLIVAQVAVAMSLLCAVGLLLRSWHALLTEDLGFDPGNLLVAKVQLPERADPDTRRSDPQVAAAMDALKGIAGVSAVTHTNVVPFGFSESINNIVVPGDPEVDTPVRSRNVGPDFFQTVGIPLLRGRLFESGDEASGAVIVDEHFASLHFPDDAVIGGKLLFPGASGDRQPLEIVGVVATAKYRTPDEQPEHGTIYQLSPEPRSDATLVISTLIAPGMLVDPVKSALERNVGPDRTGTIVTMENLVRRSVRDREPQLILLAIFGIETLALAGIGLFSLLAYSVRARTAEFGVRQAVGAKASHIRRHVLGDAVRLLVPGLLAGAAGAWAAGRVVSRRLYHVSPVDPVTWISVGLLLALVVLAAGLWPAERAARIQPTRALHHE